MARMSIAQTKVVWNDDWLQGAVVQSFVRASIGSAGVANSRAPAERLKNIRPRFYGGTTADDLVSILRASSPLAHLFELGVKPHLIGPKGTTGTGRVRIGDRTFSAPTRSAKGALALKFPDGGFARSAVNHPGMAEQPFMRPAAAAFPTLFNRELSQRLRY